MTRYSDTLAVRIDPQMNQMIAAAAVARGCKPAEWLRSTIRVGLQLDGFDFPPPVVTSRDTNEWALVGRGEPNRILTTCWRDSKPDIADTGYHPAGYKPAEGDAWVPLENADTEPFDSALHWRLSPPAYEIVSVYDQIDRVRRLYTVVPKSMEWA